MKDEEHEGLQVAQGTPVLLVFPVSPVFPAHSVAITIYAYEYTVWHGMAWQAHCIVLFDRAQDMLQRHDKDHQSQTCTSANCRELPQHSKALVRIQCKSALLAM